MSFWKKLSGKSDDPFIQENDHPVIQENDHPVIQENIEASDDFVEAKTISEPANEVAEVTEETGYAVIGGTFSNGKFFPPKPFSSWVSDGKGGWTPPLPEPSLAAGFYSEWNEEKIDWDILEFPTE